METTNRGGGEEGSEEKTVNNDEMCTRLLNIISSKTFIAWLFAFLVSMAGGVLLLFWELKYHPTNRQLWMVPFGLIFFCTPIFIIFAATLSEFFNKSGDIAPPPPHQGALAARPSQPDDKTTRDVEANSNVSDSIIITS